jgi:DNA-directed RNA polymerase specialized sigma24 family protein
MGSSNKQSARREEKRNLKIKIVVRRSGLSRCSKVAEEDDGSMSNKANKTTRVRKQVRNVETKRKSPPTRNEVVERMARLLEYHGRRLIGGYWPLPNHTGYIHAAVNAAVVHLIRYLENQEKLDPEADLEGLAITMIRRELVNLKLMRGERLPLPSGELEDRRQNNWKEQAWDSCLELLPRLKPRPRDAFTRRVIGGQKPGQIAKAMNVSTGMVRRYIRNATEQLTELLRKSE